MKIKYDYSTIPYQQKFHESAKPKVYLSTGFGGGKTYSLVMKMFQLMDLNRGMSGGLLCPTLKMYKRDVLPTIRDICSENGIRYKYNKTDFYFAFPATNSLVYIFHSEDDGASIKGPNLAWGAVNEIASIKKMAFLNFLARLRDKRARILQCVMSGTPEGFNWTYDYFVLNPRQDTDLILGNCTLNKFVHASYFGQLREDYDEVMQQMYIEGEWVNLAGNRAVHQFKRTKHVREDVVYDPGHPIWCAMDFNVAPMAASLWQRLPQRRDARTGDYKGNKLICFDEFKLMDSNTWELAGVLKNRLAELKHPLSEVVIYPDPAGRGRSTQSVKPNYSDFDILSDEGFKNLKYKTKLTVRDCINATNSLFKRDEIEISSKCLNVIADLEQCVFEKNDFRIDKSNDERSHWLDGIKNMIDYEFPVRRKLPMRQGRIV